MNSTILNSPPGKKYIMKILGLILITIIAACTLSYFTNKTTFTNWELTTNSKSQTEISWANFEWSGDTLSGKFYDKYAMLVPCKIEGLPNVFSFQFDLGANLTGVYEN